MTQEEKRRIVEMRAAGCSYIRISAELDMSVNSIKSYCRRHGLGADMTLHEAQPVQDIQQRAFCPASQETTACEQLPPCCHGKHRYLLVAYL